MKIYDYNTGEVTDITDEQYDFLHAFIKNDCRQLPPTQEVPGIPGETLTRWQSEPFWAILEGYVTVLKRSKGLTGDYLKDFLMQVLAGRKEPTDAQLKIIGHAVKVLGLGLQSRGFAGKVTLNPDSTQFEFKETSIEDGK
jgi:hypothetical protein